MKKTNLKQANIATLRKNLSSILDYVAEGHDVEVQKRNLTIAKIVPAGKPPRNRTKLGCGKGTGKILGDIVSPGIPEEDWEMLK